MNLNRRELLKASAATILAAIIAGNTAADEQFVDGGWVDLREARFDFIRNTPRPYFRQHDRAIRGTGDSTRILLWKYFEKVTKSEFVPHTQRIGDCVSQTYGLGCDILTTVQIGLHGRNEEWRGKCSTEAIYGGSRVEVGGSRINGDGSTGGWASQWVRDYGVLLRGKYGRYDLSKYDPNLARNWGRQGVPNELEAISKPHLVKTVTKVTRWTQACDLIANGYPVAICSNVGFRSKTDSEGFLSRSGKWSHAMLLFGIDTLSKRAGGCIANSWGTNWVGGPDHALGTPPGCFWADAHVIDAMLRQDDSYAISNYIGYPRQNLDYRFW